MTVTTTQENPSGPQDAARWVGVHRPYSTDDVVRLAGSLKLEHTLARHGANRLWQLLHERPFVAALGAMTGNQAMQQVRAGLEAIDVSGWQCAADSNAAGEVYPDQSLYPSNSVPLLVRRMQQALARADQIEHAEGRTTRQWFVPVLADAEAGFGGTLNAFELTKQLIEAGAAGVHFEDQLTSEKKCGHMGGKVLVPASQFVRTLVAARLAADVSGVPTVVVARTDAESARLVTSDVAELDRRHFTGRRTAEGFFELGGDPLERCVDRALTYASYADLLWMETSTPDLAQARTFAERILAHHPGNLLAYNCSPLFNWRKHLDERKLAEFQRELGAMGYRFQFVTLAGFHSLNHGMYELARGYRAHGMLAYSGRQEAEFASEAHGYSATRHQREVGTGYFDDVRRVLGGERDTEALPESTEASQFTPRAASPRRVG